MIVRMTNPPEPLDALRADVERAARRRLRNLRWWGRKWLGLQLTKLLAGAVASAGLAWIALPILAAACATIVIVLFGGYALYLRRQLVDERAMRRWAWVDGKRARQDVVSHQLALAEATLVLVGHPQDRRSRFTIRAPGSREFVSAVRCLEARVAAAHHAQRPQPPRASRHRPAVPAAPDVSAVRRRRDVLKAELSKLDAEIQALAVPDAIDVGRAAEEAVRSFKKQRDAAHEADVAARERHRAGRAPTKRAAEPAMQVIAEPGGMRQVRNAAPVSTPEQIARADREGGETRSR
jgi:hypothetical protein